MKHHEIEQQDIIERYVRHQLKSDERRTFQEHYFACDQCFDQVQSNAKFIAGVQRSARVGVLAESAREVVSAPATSWWAGWFNPAFAMAATACLLLAVALGWIVLKQIPQLQAEIAQERQAREAAEQRTGQTQQSNKEELEKERQRAEGEKNKREELENKIARNETPTPAPVTSPSRANTETKANVPVVILEATRDSKSGTNFKLPASANALTLWVEVETGNRFDSYQMQIFAANGRAVKTINGLKANSYGALAASVATQQMTAGKYLVKLFGVKDQQKELIGDYDLTLQK